MDNQYIYSYGITPHHDIFWIGLIGITIGLIIFFTAWRDWNWLQESNEQIINISWITKQFGITNTRILMGAFGLLNLSGGLFCLLL